MNTYLYAFANINHLMQLLNYTVVTFRHSASWKIMAILSGRKFVLVPVFPISLINKMHSHGEFTFYSITNKMWVSI